MGGEGPPHRGFQGVAPWENTAGHGEADQRSASTMARLVDLTTAYSNTYDLARDLVRIATTVGSVISTILLQS